MIYFTLRNAINFIYLLSYYSILVIIVKFLICIFVYSLLEKPPSNQECKIGSNQQFRWTSLNVTVYEGNEPGSGNKQK